MARSCYCNSLDDLLLNGTANWNADFLLNSYRCANRFLDHLLLGHTNPIADRVLFRLLDRNTVHNVDLAGLFFLLPLANLLLGCAFFRLPRAVVVLEGHFLLSHLADLHLTAVGLWLADLDLHFALFLERLALVNGVSDFLLNDLWDPHFL